MTTRREFFSTSGSALGGAWLARLAPLIAATQACASDAMRDGLPFTTFTEREGADFDALAARIVPTDDTPGAREAGSVYFADRALSDVLPDLLPMVRQGLASMDERVRATFPDAGAFADLPPERQDEIVAAVETEDPGFFFFARTLVLLGLVTNPEYGGNRDGVGWALLGFEDAYRYEPPFGYYDRDEHGGEAISGEAAPAAAADLGPGAASPGGTASAGSAPVSAGRGPASARSAPPSARRGPVPARGAPSSARSGPVPARGAPSSGRSTGAHAPGDDA